MTLNIWTVLWTNGEPYYYCTRPETSEWSRESRLYGPDDVIKFKRMLARKLPGRDYKFRCLSNVDIPGVEVIPLISGMKGWWPKMELFRPDLPPESGRNLYFDLDTLIVGPIGEIVKFPAPFAAIKPGPGVGSDKPKPWKDLEGFWRVPRYQTSVMVWDSQYGHKFWHAFQPEHKARLASDQDFLGEVFPNEARMPTDWFRKIRHNGMMPSHRTMVVLTMPFNNNEAAKRYPWVAKIWR